MEGLWPLSAGMVRSARGVGDGEREYMDGWGDDSCEGEKSGENGAASYGESEWRDMEDDWTALTGTWRRQQSAEWKSEVRMEGA